MPPADLWGHGLRVSAAAVIRLLNRLLLSLGFVEAVRDNGLTDDAWLPLSINPPAGRKLQVRTRAPKSLAVARRVAPAVLAPTTRRSRGSEARHAPPRATLTCALAGPLLRRPPHKPGRATGGPSPTRTAFTRTPRVSQKGSVRKLRNRASGARKAWERARQNCWRPVWHVTCCGATPL